MKTYKGVVEPEYQATGFEPFDMGGSRPVQFAHPRRLARPKLSRARSREPVRCGVVQSFPLECRPVEGCLCMKEVALTTSMAHWTLLLTQAGNRGGDCSCRRVEDQEIKNLLRSRFPPRGSQHLFTNSMGFSESKASRKSPATTPSPINYVGALSPSVPFVTLSASFQEG